MKRYGREIQRLQALSGSARSASSSQENGHFTRGSTFSERFPNNVREVGPPDDPPSSHLRALPDPPDDQRGYFGHDLPSGRDRLNARSLMDPGARGARVLVLFAAVSALVAGVYFWMSRPRPLPVSPPSGTPSLTSVAAAPTPATTSHGITVVVHVHGKVRRPGIVTLPAGSRVADAIKAAGGVRPGARTGSLNLARKLVDGEQIPVGVKGAPDAAPPGGIPGPAGPAGSAGSGGPGGTGPLDLNTATVDQLDQLPGVGPVLAQRIVDYRTQHGGFRSVEQLQEVSGIGARRYEDLKSMVRV
jgi:competence protein ComEA